jgi:fructokinase
MNALDGTVVVTGEALIDLVLARDGSLDGHPGGGPYNVARTIGRLEQPVAYLGRVSSDGFGRRLLLALESDGVAVDSIVATDAPTTLALAELDAAGAAQYHFYDAGTSERSDSSSSRWPRRSRRWSRGSARTRSSRWTRTAGRR